MKLINEMKLQFISPKVCLLQRQGGILAEEAESSEDKLIMTAQLFFYTFIKCMRA